MPVTIGLPAAHYEPPSPGPGDLEPPVACESKTFITGPAGPLTNGSAANDRAYIAGTANRTYDLTNTEFFQADVTDPYMIETTADDVCLYGPGAGKWSAAARYVTDDWQDLKAGGDLRNGAAILIGSRDVTLYKPRVHVVAVDGIVTRWNAPRLVGGTVRIYGAYLTWVRDDGLSLAHPNDDPNHVVEIYDSVIEAVNPVSWKNTNGDNGHPFDFHAYNCVFDAVPMPGRSGACPEWIVDGLANHGVFKLPGSGGLSGDPEWYRATDSNNWRGNTTRTTFTDCVFAARLKNRDCENNWPNATWNNCTMVWYGPGVYECPPQVTLTSDTSILTAKKSEVLAKAGWI
jgi:hypothetical protein